VLTALTRHNATFTSRDLDRFLAKHLADEPERAGIKNQVLEHYELIPLNDARPVKTPGGSRFGRCANRNRMRSPMPRRSPATVVPPCRWR
jgi:hypothetical protein